MPQPKVSSGPSRSATMISRDGSCRFIKMAKYNPAGPPPITFIFLIPDIQKQFGIDRMNRIAQDVQNGPLLALLRLTMNNPVHPVRLFLFCARLLL
jgi:hypothetical protein